MRHGYVFEVDPYICRGQPQPHAITCLGRYAHEALVVDPDEGTLYLTEDANGPHGLFYRWTAPPSALPLGRGSLRRLAPDAGVLEAMHATTRRGRFIGDLSIATRVGTVYDVTWKAVPERDATTTSTRTQFDYEGMVQTEGGEITRSRKLEGAWWAEGGAYFVSSFARVSPYGDVILAADGEGAQHLIGATPEGETSFLARNELEGNRVHRAELLGEPADPVRERPGAGAHLRDQGPVPAQVTLSR